MSTIHNSKLATSILLSAGAIAGALLGFAEPTTPSQAPAPVVSVLSITKGPTAGTATDVTGSIPTLQFEGTINPPLPSGVVADPNKTIVTVSCGTPPVAKTLPSDCIYLSNASAANFSFTIKDTHKCQCTGCSTMTVQFFDTTGKSLGTAAMSAPVHRKHMAIEFSEPSVRPEPQIVSIFVTDASGAIDTNYSGMVELAVFTIHGSKAVFHDGHEHIQIVVDHGHGAFGLEFLSAVPDDIVVVEAQAEGANTTRAHLDLHY